MMFFQNKNKNKGFTLIELLIIMVIIGVLAVALIPRIQGMQDKARYTKVQKDFQDFRIAAFLAQNNTNKTLLSITGNGHSGGWCTTNGLRTLAANDPCRLVWISVLRSVETAAGMSQGSLSSLEKDPRGSPYLLDENDGEIGWGCGAPDTLHTAGPDGSRTGVNRGNALLTTGDNRGINLSSYHCPGGY